MLLATATPVQMYPMECWDLLNILSQKNASVLGDRFSKWRTNSKKALDLVMGRDEFNGLSLENWEWLRNPFPTKEEDMMTFGRIRRKLNMSDDDFVINPDALKTLRGTPEERKIGRIIESGFIEKHNPFIRNIVRRTRDFLENEINPETNEPYLKKVEVKLLGENDNEAISLPLYLQEAYAYAEEFSKLLSQRIKGGGFIKTLLLKRAGSTMVAGENTAKKMLQWGIIADDEEDDNTLNDLKEEGIKDLTDEERECLEKFIRTIQINKEKDPKYQLVYDLLVKENWKEKGCIIFSQYFDSAYWVAESLSKDIKGEPIGIYAGGDKSGIIIDGIYSKRTKEEIKSMVKRYEIKILLGTDAASEGLNLQTLGTLINFDLPWNPTRLEQRKGRIQRIGQVNDVVYIYNMRYKDSVEDRVHSMLSERLENIHNMFGQIPDVLEDVWIQVALNDIEQANKIINEVPKSHPFKLKYEKGIGKVDWESCTKILDNKEKRKYLMESW